MKPSWIVPGQKDPPLAQQDLLILPGACFSVHVMGYLCACLSCSLGLWAPMEEESVLLTFCTPYGTSIRPVLQAFNARK